MPLLVAVRDLVFRSKIHAAAERLGVPIQLAPRGAPLDEAARALGVGTLLVDLGEPGAVEGIRAAKQLAGVKVIGFVGHVHDDVMRAAAEAGADEVLSRGELVRRLDTLLTEHG
jgi:DNA-binding NarL/FixJ family response regulator